MWGALVASTPCRLDQFIWLAFEVMGSSREGSSNSSSSSSSSMSRSSSRSSSSSSSRLVGVGVVVVVVVVLLLHDCRKRGRPSFDVWRAPFSLPSAAIPVSATCARRKA